MVQDYRANGVPILRTPDERFAGLPDFPFSPRYVEIKGLRLHYVDEGKGHPVLCLHGVPTWSYVYRKVIPVLAASQRVIAVDFAGFGRSDKFFRQEAHTFVAHCDILSAFLDALALERITLVAYDFGAVVGLRVATERPERFARLVIMNTTLPTGEKSLGLTFTLWKQFVELAEDLPVGMVIRMGLSHGFKISKAEIAAYEAPFPDASYKAGPVALPLNLPVRMDDPGGGDTADAGRPLALDQARPGNVLR
jgi:haloalkane dehalogenase